LAGDERSLIEAFEQFRKALVADGDWGDCHLQVEAVSQREQVKPAPPRLMGGGYYWAFYPVLSAKG